MHPCSGNQLIIIDHKHRLHQKPKPKNSLNQNSRQNSQSSTSSTSSTFSFLSGIIDVFRMTSVNTTSSSLNPNDYDPISSLEKQYAHPPVGRRLTLVLKINNECIVRGGVDTILKNGDKSSLIPSTSSLSTMDPAAGIGSGDNAIVDNMNDLSLNQHQQQKTDVDTNFTPSTIGGNNPFDFLYDENQSATTGLSGQQNGGVKIIGGGNERSGKQFKVSSIFAKAKNQFERGVTSIAVQAQRATSGGASADIRDVITIGAYVHDSATGKYNTCLGMTERYKLPSKPDDPNDDPNNGEGITFQIPILIPPHLYLDAKNGGLNIEFKLWMRSNAAIFAKNRALRRYYSAGSAMLRLGNLMQVIKPNLVQPVILSVPVQSTVINGGKLTLVAMPDTKFPQLCGNGWSLSDPRTDTAYLPTTGKKILYNPPLDQNYIFPVPKTEGSGFSSLLVTTERTTESTIVLPLAVAYLELAQRAADRSRFHALELTSKLQCLDGASSIHDPMKAMQLGHAQVQIEVNHFLRYNSNSGASGDSGGGSVSVMLNLQRPDSIFENCIANGTIPSQPYIPNASYPQHPAISVPFYPRVVLSSDPRLLPGENTATKKFHVGKLRFEMCEHGIGGAGADVFSPIGPAGSVGTCARHMEAIIDLDTYINRNHETLIQASVVDLKTGGAVGLLVLKIAATTMEGMVDRSSNDISTSATGKRSIQSSVVEDGLISFVGLNTLMEDEKACYPHSDLDSESASRVFSQIDSSASNEDRIADRRKRQISTMGEFLTYVYMNHHAKGNRTNESKFMNEKFEAYKVALFTPPNDDEEILGPDKNREPRSFRPSSSRMEPILSSIGFNIHLQNFCVTTVTTDEASGKTVASPTGLFKNVTCGAPSDHFRGFGKKGQSEPVFSGGLRRLEATRLSTAEYVRDTQDSLIEAIGSFYSAQSQSTNIHLPGRSARHISPSNHEISSQRTVCIAATQRLHTLTWEIAVRRANCFSQALGIAVTLYLGHVSDTAKLQRGAWAELWTKHGFLVTFEGLLSAAGKELGMIEDAAVGISMLRMASIVFVTETNNVGKEKSSSCIPVPDSPYIKWVRINPSGNGTQTKYLVEICVDANFYAQKIPSPLKGNTPVRFYPMLYEMGVDIRQWGSNAAAANFNKNNTTSQDDMDDDEVGIPDNDVLIALNYEAFRKMNAYAHSVYRCNEEPSVTWEQANADQLAQQPIHPMLNDLHEFIKSSAGKMEHGILDEAAHAAAKLGGGAAIFCKSGKDRTAMQVTFKQSQFINRYLQTGGNGHADDCKLDSKIVFQDANLMRVYGTRLPICDKNVGQSLYAFNALQARFMPDVLKPPNRALAGFLKGGRVFREGAIES
jgi:hypothetical protein